MLPNKTVFVIGAGSGFDIKMPLGSDLLGAIQRNTKFRVSHGTIHEEPESLVRAMFWEPVPNEPHRIIRRSDAQQILEANEAIGKAADLIGSIDDYVNLHSSNPLIVHAAKVQIAYYILACENLCPLLPSQTGGQLSDLAKVRGTWLMDLFKLISKPSNSAKPEDIFKNISFINFNYDRCLEQFLLAAIVSLYNIRRDHAAQLIKDATIVHPYGQIGDLPAISNNETSVPFGECKYLTNVWRAANLIKTYTEQVNSSIVTNIKNIINESTRVVFLGFGFHKQNIELLAGPTMSEVGRVLYATALKESEANILEYAKRLRRVGGSRRAGQEMPGNMYLEQKLNCSELIQYYREVLAS